MMKTPIRHDPPSTRFRRPGLVRILGGALLLLAGLVCGCPKGGEDVTLDAMKKKMYGPTPTELVAMAFDPNDPDRRREGIAQLSGKGWGLQEPYLKGYATVLENDGSPPVRSAAVTALGMAGDVKYLANIVMALSDSSASVRWDAATALDKVTGDAAMDPLQRHAVDDPSSDVRMCCARALRHYRAMEVIKTLVRCMGDEAFAVKYAAHASLVELTGMDPGKNAEDWFSVAEGIQPPNPPPAAKPWWDWFNTTGRKSVPQGSMPAAKPSSAPENAMEKKR